MNRQLVMLLIVLGLCGCNRTSVEPSAKEPDNSGVNARDRDANAKTPLDQNENQADVEITASIRRQIRDKKMSVNADNAKVITQDGKVTLRGPVKSEEEKKQIEEIAKAVAGAGNVGNHLEVE